MIELEKELLKNSQLMGSSTIVGLAIRPIVNG